MQKLTNTKIKSIKPSDKVKKISDGEGLTLVIKPTGSKLFNYNFRFHNKQRTMSFGKYPEVSLAEARNQVKEVKKLLKQGIDPVRHREQESLKVEFEHKNTFEYVSREWLKKQKSEVSEGHYKRCSRMIEIHLIPEIGKTPLKQITTPEVLRALRKIEVQGKLETAHRARQVAGQVFRFGIQSGIAKYDVTQHLRGTLKAPKPKHFSAITSPDELGALLRDIDDYHGAIVVRTALKLTPHLFARPGELRKLRWQDVDLENELVKIPDEHMKSEREHWIPLSSVRKDLSLHQKDKDFKARMTISHELGHGRESVTAVYLGR